MTNSDKSLSVEVNQVPPKIDVDSTFSTGTMRTSGAWIGIMLQAEDADTRKEIIVDLVNTFGMDFDDLKRLSLTKDVMCDQCGISMYLHSASGQCPDHMRAYRRRPEKRV